MNRPPEWSTDELRAELERSVEIFRRERMQEPLDDYLEAFEEYQGHFEVLLESSVDLTQLEDQALEVLTDPALIDPFRYLTGPPISVDDLKTVAEAVLTRTRLRSDPAMVRRIVEVILIGLDRKRFPWVKEHRAPTEAEREAAVIASAALMATQRVGTRRRSEGKAAQEAKVKESLIRGDFTEVPTRTVSTFAHAPEPGMFCGESVLGDRKADFIVRLWDTRIMPIECKVSNSALNSIKRLNNDAAVKAGHWRERMGSGNVVPTAVLGGVYKLRHLTMAQEAHLTLFWAHDLDTMLDWIEKTRPGNAS